MSGLKVESSSQPIYEKKSIIVEPETKAQINIGAALRMVHNNLNNGMKAGVGGEIGVEKNFNLGEKSYLNTGADLGVYSNALQAKMEMNWKQKKQNFTPVLGAEVQYTTGPKQKITHGFSVDGNVAQNLIKYSEQHFDVNGKLGIEARTNNQKFTFGSGLKLGYTVADGGFMSKLKINQQLKESYTDEFGNVSEIVTNKEYVDIYGYKPYKGLNAGVYADAELKLNKGLSLKAAGEYSNSNRAATLGVKYTF